MERSTMLLVFGLLSAAAAAASTEADILLAAKDGWKTSPALSSWANACSLCTTWAGVQCDAAGRVNSINLYGADLHGPFPHAICNLTHITSVNMGNNYITGKFPESIYHCRHLIYLDLSMNLFVGELPHDIGFRLPAASLKYLNLSMNNFSGEVPASLSKLKLLTTLGLADNLFHGSVPASVGRLSMLEELSLSYQFTIPSTIPRDFACLTHLTYLWMSSAKLVGKIPNFLCHFPHLQHLDLANNNLFGSIPPNLWSLKKLKYLYLYNNSLSGSILINGNFGAAAVAKIDMGQNSLSGSIPAAFGTLANLTDLVLYRNNFSREIPVSIGTLPSIVDIRLFSNKLTGVLPPELGMHSKLKNLEVSENEMSGELPPGLCHNGAFWSLVVYNNHRMTGPIPAGLGKCATLSYIQLENNMFSGEVPPGIWAAKKLTWVRVSNNRLSGTLPAALPSSLTSLRISNNNFSGPLPSSAPGLVILVADGNSFGEGLPPSLLASAPLLERISLARNRLTGAMPESVASLQWLLSLNLSNNRFSGSIPAAIGGMRSLSWLDLSRNDLAGEIPSSLVNLKLNGLNLSNNNLSGAVPEGLAQADNSQSFAGNPALCSPPSIPANLLAGVRSCNDDNRGDGSRGGSSSSTHLLLTLVLVGSFVIAVVIGLFVVLVIRNIKRRRQRSGTAGESAWKLTSFHRLEFTESDILGGLTAENLVGEGGGGQVYRVAFTSRVDGAEGIVAVKRILTDGWVSRHAEQQFDSEVKILGAIRHINIVKLLCCLVRPDTKLLVYEYMEKSSLDRWLHDERQRRGVLDWPARVRIAIGAARGLAYMHHYCKPPVLHRDVKSSNILITADFGAKIADFGLSRLLPNSGDSDSTSVVAGTFGYLAPEYAETMRVNNKVDVYSFGVVLLELVTGKKATRGNDEHQSLAQWAWSQSNDSIADVVDQRMDKESISPQDLMAMFKLGQLCTSSSPSERPTMEQVMWKLQGCERNQPPAPEQQQEAPDSSPVAGAGDATLATSENKEKQLC